jgi:solute carrier family 25 protein 14/30
MDQRRLIRCVTSGQYYPEKIYRSSVHCCLATVKNEGVLALYRGFVPSFMRMGPWNVIFFVVYEQLKKQNFSS